MRIEGQTFTLPQILSLIGIGQCILIMVYMAFRSGRLSRAGLPFAYFLVLGLAFTLDFAEDFISGVSSWYPVWQWLAWFSGPPLSVLLIVQIARITHLPDLRHYAVLATVPVAFALSAFSSRLSGDCGFLQPCPEFVEVLRLTGFMAGGISLLALWFNRGLMESILIQKEGRDRFWLVMAIVVVNVLFLGVALALLCEAVSPHQAMMIRAVLGTGFVYLATTSLFRIYPPSVRLENSGVRDDLTDAELDVALKIERLLDLDKIYHEPAYARSDLARELNVSEAVVSRVINLHFRKSFPQLLNERRVEDAKRMLRQTKVSIKTIAEEVGFNSIASFNRVFKDMTGDAPGAYRQDNAE